MPEIVADPPSPSRYPLFCEAQIEESQRLGPDPFLPPARDTRALYGGRAERHYSIDGWKPGC